MNALMAAHALTAPGWDTEGPADMATWVGDGADNEVVAFDTGNTAQDVCNAAFVVMAHQALPLVNDQMTRMREALQAVVKFCRETDFPGVPGAANPGFAVSLAKVMAMCQEASGNQVKGNGAYEFKVNVPGATPEVRAALADNYPTKAQAVQAAHEVLAGSAYEKAVIFRIELDGDGHVVQHEVSQFVSNPSF